MGPPFFALEAEPRCGPFVEHFVPDIFDPQAEGMGEVHVCGEFPPRLERRQPMRGAGDGQPARSGRESDPAGGRADADLALEPPKAKPSARAWRSRLRPEILLVELEGHARSFVVWPDAIPITLPRVDLVVIPREELAPRRLLLRRPDMMLALWNEVDALLPGLVHEPSAHPEYWVLGPPRTADAVIVHWVRSQ